VRLHDRKGRAAGHEVAVVGAAGVGVLQPALELGVEVGQASEVLAVEGGPVELLQGGPLEAFTDRVVVGRPGRDATVADVAARKVAGEGATGELRAVEFLMVVKGLRLGSGWPVGRASSWSAWRLLARCARPACGGGCGRC